MERKVPEWLDNAFLASALQGGEDREPRVAVKSFSAKLAVPPGNNYTSYVFRVRVEYRIGSEEKSTSLIIKAPIANIMPSFESLFDKEPKMYSDFFPTIKRLTGFQFAPKLYYSSIPNTMVMDDLNEKGFSLSDRYKQLDFSHCDLVLKTLAKFHAASVLCKRNYPEIIEQVGKEILYVDSIQFEKGIKAWIQGGLAIVMGMVEKLGLGKAAEDLFSTRVNTAVDTQVRLCQPRTRGINVLNHGDLWTCNMLFKHNDSGEVVDLRLLDFQATKYTSPVMDLVHFIWTSANEDVRETRLPELLENYKLTLNSTLELLGCEERLTEEQFRGDLKDAIDCVILTVCAQLPVQMSEPTDIIVSEEINFEDMQAATAMFEQLYSGKYYQALLPKVVKHILEWVARYE